MTADLRACPGCDRVFAMLHICERCGRCDALDLPRDADRDAPCCADGVACVETDWRSATASEAVEPKHITDQQWLPELRDDGVYLVGADDRTVVVKLSRPDRDSDLIIAGYITGLQAHQLKRFGTGGKS